MFSLLTLSPYQLFFVAEIMLGYFFLSSNNLCICNLLHVIYLLVSSDSPPPSLFYALILCVLYHIWTISSLPFSSTFLGVHADITPWVVLWSLWFCHWILHLGNPWGQNTHCSPTVNWHQMVLWKAPVPIRVHTGIPSQTISTQKVKKYSLCRCSDQYLQSRIQSSWCGFFGNQ